MIHMKKIILVVSLCFILLSLVACNGSEKVGVSTSNGEENVGEDSAVVYTGTIHQVVIENNQFMPTDLDILLGDTVEWVNKDSLDHTVTFENGDFSQKLSPGGTTTFTYKEIMQFPYFCSIHPGMRGNIIVN